MNTVLLSYPVTSLKTTLLLWIYWLAPCRWEDSNKITHQWPIPYHNNSDGKIWKVTSLMSLIPDSPPSHSHSALTAIWWEVSPQYYSTCFHCYRTKEYNSPISSAAYYPYNLTYSLRANSHPFNGLWFNRIFRYWITLCQPRGTRQSTWRTTQFLSVLILLTSCAQWT